MLVLCSDKCGSNATYYVVASKTFPKFAFIVDLIVFIKCFGVAISYLVIVGDNLPDSACFFLNGVKNGSSCVADGQVIDSFLLAREFWIGMVCFLGFLKLKPFTTFSLRLSSSPLRFCLLSMLSNSRQRLRSVLLRTPATF